MFMYIYIPCEVTIADMYELPHVLFVEEKMGMLNVERADV